MNSIKYLIHNSGIDASVVKTLLCKILHISQVELLMQYDYCPNKDELNQFNTLLNEFINGKPISYIVGHTEFYSNIFIVNQNVLIPRHESEFIVDLILKFSKLYNYKKILELGTGSGCIAISCKLANLNLDVTATDISKLALNVAEINAKRHNVLIDYRLSNWFHNINDKYDLIISNPPYIAYDDNHLDKLSYEPIIALTDFKDGLSHIKHIIVHANKYLNHHGYLLIEHGYLQGESVRLLFQENNFYDINTIYDYAKLERVTYGHI